MVGVQMGDQRDVGDRSRGRGGAPRLRRRCASRRAKRGSVSTRVPESSSVQVACPHQVISTGTSLPPSHDSPRAYGQE